MNERSVPMMVSIMNERQRSSWVFIEADTKNKRAAPCGASPFRGR